MDILCNMSLSDHKIKDKLIPLSLIPDIDNIYVVRNTRGPDIDKVKYIEVGSNKNKNLQYLKRIIILFKSILKYNPSFVIGYLFFPHGISSLIISKLLFKKSVMSLIAGPIELTKIVRSQDDDIDYNQNNFKLSKLALFILNRFNKIAVTGKYTKNILVNNGIPEKKIFIIPNVIDTSKFLFNPKNIKDKDFLVLSNLSKQKNIHLITQTLITAFKENKNINGLIIGNGPEKNNLRQTIMKNKMETRIRMLDYTNNPEDYFNRSKFFIFASRREGMPATVLEAMSCGCIPILYPCGDIMDYVNENNSLIYSKMNEYSILSVLKNINYIDHESMSKNARKETLKIDYKISSEKWEELLI